MVSSLTHMLACIQGTKIAAETRNDFESIKDGLKYKKDLLVLSLLCTAGLVIFFLQHRFFCFRMGKYYYTKGTIIHNDVYPILEKKAA